MLTTVKFPTTRQELLEAGGAGLVHFPASFEEYWTLLKTAEYRADFYQNEIIAMSYETDLHSHIMFEFLFLLKNIFPNRVKYRVHNSNRPVYVKYRGEPGVFNPDGSVVSQPPVYFEYQPGMNAETTPIILFEVLSPSTRHYDFGTKLPCYKSIATLQYIVYLETDRPSVLLYERKSENSWTETEFTKADDVLWIEHNQISLKDIYANIYF